MSDRTRARAVGIGLVVATGLSMVACGGGDDAPLPTVAVPTVTSKTTAIVATEAGAASVAPDASAPPTAATSTSSPVPAPTAQVSSSLELQMPAIDVVAPVIEVGVTADLVLEIPEDPAVVGRWSDGARPGDGTGSVVLAGHVDYRGVRGALASLTDLAPGDEVVLAGTGGSFRYVTDRVDVLKKQALPYQEIFQFDIPERLVVITCGGRFDRSTGHYESNVVAYLTRA